MLLAGTKTDVNGFGWRHLNELLSNSEVDSLTANLTDRERLLIEYCVKVAYSFDHDGGAPAYSGSGAIIACVLTQKLLGKYDYGTPYTSHAECLCPTCIEVRKANAKQGWPRCKGCGRYDSANSRSLSEPPWFCNRCKGEE